MMADMMVCEKVGYWVGLRAFRKVGLWVGWTVAWKETRWVGLKALQKA